MKMIKLSEWQVELLREAFALLARQARAASAPSGPPPLEGSRKLDRNSEQSDQGEISFPM